MRAQEAVPVPIGLLLGSRTSASTNASSCTWSHAVGSMSSAALAGSGCGSEPVPADQRRRLSAGIDVDDRQAQSRTAVLTISVVPPRPFDGPPSQIASTMSDWLSTVKPTRLIGFFGIGVVGIVGILARAGQHQFRARPVTQCIELIFRLLVFEVLFVFAGRERQHHVEGRAGGERRFGGDAVGAFGERADQREPRLLPRRARACFVSAACTARSNAVRMAATWAATLAVASARSRSPGRWPTTPTASAKRGLVDIASPYLRRLFGRSWHFRRGWHVQCN